MNGIQIEHILRLIEEKSVTNRESIRREAAAYLREHMMTVLNSLAHTGETVIPWRLRSACRLRQ
jgi:hypothetical protein